MVAETDRALAARSDRAAAYRAGKAKLIGFLIGQIMTETGGKVSLTAVNEALYWKAKYANDAWQLPRWGAQIISNSSHFDSIFLCNDVVPADA